MTIYTSTARFQTFLVRSHDSTDSSRLQSRVGVVDFDSASRVESTTAPSRLESSQVESSRVVATLVPAPSMEFTVLFLVYDSLINSEVTDLSRVDGENKGRRTAFRPHKYHFSLLACLIASVSWMP